MTAGVAIRHRRGCAEPGWISDSPVIAGCVIARCGGCGAARIVQPTANRKARP